MSDDRHADRPIIDLATYSGFKLDLGEHARHRISAAQQRLGLSTEDFATALNDLVEWDVTVESVENWMTGVTPPADILLAADLLVRRGDRGADDITVDMAGSDIVEYIVAERFALGDFAVGQDAQTKNKVRVEIARRMAATALRVRMLGSAAIDLAWVAEGRLDASITLSNNPWDMAAGVVVAREAGARVADLDGSDYRIGSRAVLAARPDLIDEVVSIVRDAGRVVTGSPTPPA
jgi:Inositol monophosphatase family